MNQTLIAPDSSIGIGGLHWMADSRIVITGGGDQLVKVWNVEGETKLVKSYSTSNCVTSLFVNEACMTIAAGVAGADGIVHVWQPYILQLMCNSFFNQKKKSLCESFVFK